jgi:hypothetical protein
MDMTGVKVSSAPSIFCDFLSALPFSRGSGYDPGVFKSVGEEGCSTDEEGEKAVGSASGRRRTASNQEEEP